MTVLGDPNAMTTAELRSARANLQMQEDVISFVRRMAQGRCDLARDEQRRRVDGTPASGMSVVDIANVFGQEHGGGSSRPPRETNISADHELVVELERLCERVGFGELRTLDDDALELAIAEIEKFELARSAERKSLFAKIDALTTELVKRYKDGGANVETLLTD
ncbi:MAG: hypothetical protein EB142_01305 [Actinobacteria bacterium]|nr:hypothetical protein [Actinomycetota bacterium]NDD72314.1 hypothetical protein [Actinomycetota bacterium]NDF66509.1 hypothetical protein [Actinomycetota bacterium]